MNIFNTSISIRPSFLYALQLHCQLEFSFLPERHRFLLIDIFVKINVFCLLCYCSTYVFIIRTFTQIIMAIYGVFGYLDAIDLFQAFISLCAP